MPTLASIYEENILSYNFVFVCYVCKNTNVNMLFIILLCIYQQQQQQQQPNNDNES